MPYTTPIRNVVGVHDPRTDGYTTLETAYSRVDRIIQELHDEADRAGEEETDGIKRPHVGPSEAALRRMKYAIQRLMELADMTAEGTLIAWRTTITRTHQEQIERLAFRRGGTTAVERTALHLDPINDTIDTMT